MLVNAYLLSTTFTRRKKYTVRVKESEGWQAGATASEDDRSERKSDCQKANKRKVKKQEGQINRDSRPGWVGIVEVGA